MIRRTWHGLSILWTAIAVAAAGCAGPKDADEPPIRTADGTREAWGMAAVDRLYSGYGEGAPRGPGPDQGRINAEGNAYLEREFPKLDYIEKATVLAGGTDETYRVKLDTTQGDVVIAVHPEWAPLGAARFRELVEAGFYDGCRFFRVLDGFMAQTGISGDPDVNAEWRERTIPDDPVVKSNTRGYVSFATSGPNSRTTQFFINYGDNSQLDDMGFSPFGKVEETKPDDAPKSGTPSETSTEAGRGEERP